MTTPTALLATGLGARLPPVVVVGVVVAAAAWGVMFAAHRQHFWRRAAGAGAVIGLYAVATSPRRIGALFTHGDWVRQVGLGVAAGVALYVVFWVGEQLLVIALPTLAAEVGDLYDVRGETRPGWMPVVLAIAAPGEELFFRGFVQVRAGFVIALVAYGLVHLWERKVILVAAAVAGGAWWGALLTLTGGLVAPVVSHLLWCLMIIVWRPARPAAWATAMAGRVRAPFGPRP